MFLEKEVMTQEKINFSCKKLSHKSFGPDIPFFQNAKEKNTFSIEK